MYLDMIPTGIYLPYMYMYMYRYMYAIEERALLEELFGSSKSFDL